MFTFCFQAYFGYVVVPVLFWVLLRRHSFSYKYKKVFQPTMKYTSILFSKDHIFINWGPFTLFSFALKAGPLSFRILTWPEISFPERIETSTLPGSWFFLQNKLWVPGQHLSWLSAGCSYGCQAAFRNDTVGDEKAVISAQHFQLDYSYWTSVTVPLT